MTQQKYIVTDDQLQNLFESGMRNANVLAQRSFVKQNSVYKQCLEIPYVEPADDWRKKWHPVAADLKKIVYVSEPDSLGSVISIQRNEEGRLTHFYHSDPGSDRERGHSWALMKKEPEVVKVERWLLLDRNGNSFGFAYTSEQTAREAGCELDKACRFIKVEGSYTK